MELKYNNLIMDIDVIGGFKIDSHEYAVCSYIDSEKNSKIIVVEIFRDGHDIKTKAIPDEDMDMVITKYKEIKDYLLGGN